MPNSQLELNPFRFESNIYSLDRLMVGGIENELGLVIPDFQRKYTWEEGDIKRFFGDILLALSDRASKPSSNFFGATLWNKRERGLEDEFKVASYDIVDGQQRITTCALLNMALFEVIKNNHQVLLAECSLPKNLAIWLETQRDAAEDVSHDMLFGELRRGDQPYPRIICEEDVRGKTFSTSDYVSPIAQLQLEFHRVFLSRKPVSTDFIKLKVIEEEKNVYELLIENIEHFRRYFNGISEKTLFEEFNVPFIQKGQMKSKHFKELLKGEAFPESEFDRALNSEPLFEKQIRLLHFWGHFFKASCFTVILCRDENAAFSIFDSLNTTGVPLTGIETLKPYVMRNYREDKEKFKGSKSEENFNYIDKIIRAAGNNTQKQSSLSKEAIIHTSLLAGGKLMGNNLNVQRTAIIDTHKKCNDNGNKDLVSTVLKKLFEYKEGFSSIDKIEGFHETTLDANQNEDIKLISAFLSNTNTQLYRPVLTRFYWASETQEIFHQACKAIAAFYVLRRATTNGTDRIDDKYRECLIGTSSYSGLNLDFKNPKKLSQDDLESFKIHLKTCLSSSNLNFTIFEKPKWVDHVKGMAHFSGAKSLLRFMLFAAHDGTKIDLADKTLVQREDATADTSTEFLTFNNWRRDLYQTLEHVAPQNEQSIGWSEVYENPKLKDTIGNFVLLPRGQNSALKDAEWSVKKLFLRTLLLDSKAERQKLIATSKADGLKLPPSIEGQVLSGEVYPLIKSNMLSGLENIIDWDKTFIEKRSKRLCELVWDRMVSWLA